MRGKGEGEQEEEGLGRAEEGCWIIVLGKSGGRVGEVVSRLECEVRGGPARGGPPITLGPCCISRAIDLGR